MRKIFLVLSIAFCCHCFALTCPAISEIKQRQFLGWQPLMTTSNNPASKELIDEFVGAVDRFNVAEWYLEERFGACCYYSMRQGKEDVEVYLAHESSGVTNKNMWHWLGNYYAKCIADNLEQCAFN